MRQEVRRGRKFIEYQDDSLPVGTLVQEIGAHDVSYLDENGAWLPADENWAADGLDGFILKNDKLNHKVRLKGTGGRTWYPRRNVNTEYMTFGVPQYRNGTKWSNFSFSGWSVEGKTITLNTRQGVTILVHSLWSGIKIDWVLANASAPTRMRYPVTLTGITESDGVLHGADGSELGRLTPTTATDANGLELACTGSFSGGYVEFSADVTGGMYPIIVDPDFASGTSFGQAQGSDRYYMESYRTDSLAVGQYYTIEDGYNAIFRAFIKFDTSSIPDTDTVTQANLRLVVYSDLSDVDFDVQIAKYNWSANDPMVFETSEAAYQGCLAADADDSIWRNTNGISTNTQYTSGNLSTTWVNKTGATYYGLRSSRDASDIQATGNENVSICTPSHATESYRPVLTVTYTAAAPSGAVRITPSFGTIRIRTGSVAIVPTTGGL